MKEEIIQTAITLYAKYGIKGGTMEQLSKQVHISKKTLYQEFESKEELIKEVANLATHRVSQIVKGAEAKSGSPIEAILLISGNSHNFLGSFCPAFYKNIRLFRDAVKLVEKNKENIQERLAYLFQKGVEQGLFLPGNDYHVISTIYNEQLRDASSQHLLSTIFTFLRGVSTIEGERELQQYANMYKKMNINHKNIYNNERETN